VPDSPAGRRDPAPLPRGRVPAHLAPIRDRATRVREVRATLEQSASSSAYRPPCGPEPVRRHEIIPQQTAAGYRCGTCLVPVTPADYATGPAWHHAANGGQP
jgi:hypothetical protein